MLTVTDLSAGYNRRPVLHGVTLPPLENGCMAALIGPNAAGKTTFLRALAGLAPAKGSIRLMDRELLGTDPADHARHVTYMPQSLPQRASLTVFEGVLAALMASPGTRPARTQAEATALATLQRLRIADLAHRRLDQLSGGQRQLASLAQAIARQPAVLLLDEPTSALDPAHQFRVMDTVAKLTRERNIVTVLVLHDLALACRWCDCIVVLSKGRIAAAGTPQQAITRVTLADVYGLDARTSLDSNGHLRIDTDGLVEDR